MMKSNLVMFGTPGHYVERLIRERYPDADFFHMKFADNDDDDGRDGTAA